MSSRSLAAACSSALCFSASASFFSFSASAAACSSSRRCRTFLRTTALRLLDFVHHERRGWHREKPSLARRLSPRLIPVISRRPHGVWLRFVSRHSSAESKSESVRWRRPRPCARPDDDTCGADSASSSTQCSSTLQLRMRLSCEMSMMVSDLERRPPAASETSDLRYGKFR